MTAEMIGRGKVQPAEARGLVWSIAYSPDGRRLAIGQQGLDGTGFASSASGTWPQKKDVIWLAGRPPIGASLSRRMASNLAAGTASTCRRSFAGSKAISRTSCRASGADLGEPINALAFLPDSRAVAMGDWGG